jgi:hypothetical protein
LDEYKAQKLFTNDPKIDVNYIIGETPYTKGVDKPDDEKYKKEQFVRFVLKVEGEAKSKDIKNLIPEGMTCTQEDFRDKKGGVAGVETDFLSEEYKFVYPDGEGKIVIKVNPADVPDMFIYNYNGEKKSTGFLGVSNEYYRLALGTLIGNVYKEKEKPWYFKDIKYKELDEKEAERILDEAKSGTLSDPNDFKYAFPDKKLNPQDKKMFRKNKDIVPYILDKDQVKNFDKEKGVDWMISLDKKEKVNDLIINVTGPVGQTRWSLKFQC